MVTTAPTRHAVAVQVAELPDLKLQRGRTFVLAIKDGLRKCLVCRVWFLPARDNQVNCSPECRSLAYRRKRSA